MRNTNRGIFQLVVMTALTCLICSNQAFAQDNKLVLPDTPAGKAMARFVACIEQPDAEQRVDFLSTGFGVKVPPLEQRKSFFMQLHSDLKLLTLNKLTRSEELVVEAEFLSANGKTLKLLVEVSKEDPRVIDDVDLDIVLSEEFSEISPLDDKARARVLKSIRRELNEKYVFPEVAARMSASVSKTEAAGGYDGITSQSELADKLTKQLMEICNDKHFRIVATRPDTEGSPVRRQAPANHGFEKVECYPDGIGYLKFDFFSGDPDAESTAAAAMNFLANSKALIVDLRENGGGNPKMIAFLTSYLFDDKVHLNSFYNRPTDTTSESWTRTDVPGKRLGSKIPVYVLTSDYTFSGAEEFSYNLQNLKRGTIVGEVTGGGAHPVMRVSVEHGLSISLPFARAINPITKTNWEGVGVKPEIEVPAKDALEKALQLARERIDKAR